MSRRRRTPVTIAGLIVAVLAALLGQRLLAPTTPPGTPAAPATRAFPFDDAERAKAIEQTLALIDRGGPFPHKRDGVVFHNREGRLPKQADGYYREYTVPTPGSRDRGARRIVRGAHGDTWYTDDHYRTFVRIGPP